MLVNVSNTDDGRDAIGVIIEIEETGPQTSTEQPSISLWSLGCVVGWNR
jgi:hypothetical protein